MAPVLATADANARTVARVSVRRKISHDEWFRYATLTPAIVLLVVLTVYPAINLVMMSVSSIGFAHGELRWTFT